MKEYIFAACGVKNYDSDMLKIRYFNDIKDIEKWIKSFISTDKSLPDDVKQRMFDDTLKSLNATGKATLKISDMYLLCIEELSLIKKIKDR